MSTLCAIPAVLTVNFEAALELPTFNKLVLSQPKYPLAVPLSSNFILKVSSAMKPVNIKKGQFLSPLEMINVVEKAKSTGNKDIFVCERGVSFGYNNLVSDMRSLVLLRETKCPVIYDASHSVQYPGKDITSSGGGREFIPSLAKAATAVGIDALFIETHPNPAIALSDGKNSLNLDNMKSLLESVVNINDIVKR